MKKLLLSLLLVLACSLPVQAAEIVTINDVNKDDVYNHILTTFMKSGFMIQESNEHNLIFRNDRSDMNFAINWGSDAYRQFAFNLAQIENNVLVSYEIRIISGNKVHPLTKEAIPYYFPVNKDDAERGLNGTLSFLRHLKLQFNGAYIFGFNDTGKKKKDYVEITEVTPNYPFEKAGIKAGDRIVKINEQYIKKLSYFAFDTIIIQSLLNNQPINLQVRRNKDILDFKVIPIFEPAKKLEAQ